MSEEGMVPDSVERAFWKFTKIGLIMLVVTLCIFAVIFMFTMVASVGVGHAVILVDPVARSTSDPILGPTCVLKAP